MFLEDGARVGIIGGGPAGSMTAFFLLTFAQRADLKLAVDVYEPRDFLEPGPAGCNMCGGIVSEPLVQTLAVEGIRLPPSVVQRGIDSYVLHRGSETVNIATPLSEKRIAALHRGGGPRGFREMQYGGLDGYLLGLARDRGARVIAAKVRQSGRGEDGRPWLGTGKERQTYDLVVGASGVNPGDWSLYENLGFRCRSPRTARTYITEIRLGAEQIGSHFGNAVHIFFDNMPGLDMAAIIPKGEFVTICLLGEGINQELIQAFCDNPAVRACFPPTWDGQAGSCRCFPKINIRPADFPCLGRAVLVGDCGATRLYKDGIGAAYRTAKAAATTAVFSGVSHAAFARHYRPVYRSIIRDNRYGWAIFMIVDLIKKLEPLARGALSMTAKEQSQPESARRMSVVMWDMFTGSAPYRDVFFKTLDPRFWARFMWETARNLRARRPRPPEEA
ncbi:MAG: hypothetical protein BIFFINMI_01265 [Phycisphaerae bacterium]|nr:hypothetical protein [Phycisphaerae bacterium]